MENKGTNSRDFYEHVSQIITELTKMRALGLQEHKLDLDHFLLLEAIATANCCSEADVVRTFGRNASFYSRAADQLVKRGWLRKRLKPRLELRFEVKITAKGRDAYSQIQAAFAERLNQTLAPAMPQRRKAIVKRLMEFQKLLSEQQLASAAPTALQDEEVKQLHLSDL